MNPGATGLWAGVLVSEGIAMIGRSSFSAFRAHALPPATSDEKDAQTPGSGK